MSKIPLTQLVAIAADARKRNDAAFRVARRRYGVTRVMFDAAVLAARSESGSLIDLAAVMTGQALKTRTPKGPAPIPSIFERKKKGSIF